METTQNGPLHVYAIVFTGNHATSTIKKTHLAITRVRTRARLVVTGLYKNMK